MTTSGSAADQPSVDSTNASPVLMTILPIDFFLLLLAGFFLAMLSLVVSRAGSGVASKRVFFHTLSVAAVDRSIQYPRDGADRGSECQSRV